MVIRESGNGSADFDSSPRAEVGYRQGYNLAESLSVRDPRSRRAVARATSVGRSPDYTTNALEAGMLSLTFVDKTPERELSASFRPVVEVVVHSPDQIKQAALTLSKFVSERPVSNKAPYNTSWVSKGVFLDVMSDVVINAVEGDFFDAPEGHINKCYHYLKNVTTPEQTTEILGRAITSLVGDLSMHSEEELRNVSSFIDWLPFHEDDQYQAIAPIISEARAAVDAALLRFETTTNQ